MGEEQYINLVKRIISEGTVESTRNGETISLFGEQMKFSLKDNVIPFITTKKLAWKTCLKELLWFISGSTNNNVLLDQNVKIWNDNAKDYEEQFFKRYNRVLSHDGDLGPIYGHQWRHYNAPYINSTIKYKDKGIDQLQNIINMLKDPTQRTSRRIILNSWNPDQLDEMALPPCHILCQFHVSNNNRLHCCMYQRSGDIGLGIPFNIASYCLLTHIIAKICCLEAYEFTHFIGNAHIYTEHKDALLQQINNKPYPFPTIEIQENITIDNIDINMIKIHNYLHNDEIKMKMKV